MAISAKLAKIVYMWEKIEGMSKIAVWLFPPQIGGKIATRMGHTVYQ